jgi:DNA polymerase III epsilon subunit-like protein
MVANTFLILKYFLILYTKIANKMNDTKVQTEPRNSTKYVIFDTETTGLPKNYSAPLEDLDNWPRLVQLAWIIYDSQGVLLEKSNYIIIPKEFSINNSFFHGITTEKAEREGVPLSEALDRFKLALDKNTIIVAHNVDFDYKILASEYLRSGQINPFVGMKKICTMASTRRFVNIPGAFKGSFKWPKLSELYTKLFTKSVSADQYHSADKDVEITAACFWQLKKTNFSFPVRPI